MGTLRSCVGMARFTSALSGSEHKNERQLFPIWKELPLIERNADFAWMAVKPSAYLTCFVVTPTNCSLSSFPSLDQILRRSIATGNKRFQQILSLNGINGSLDCILIKH